MGDLKQWARETAKTLDDLDWENLESSENLDTFDEWDLTPERHRALLDHVRELAAGHYTHCSVGAVHVINRATGMPLGGALGRAVRRVLETD